MSEKLAILGGTPVRSKPFAPRKTMQVEEKSAVNEVMDSDCLSGFFGAPSEQFLGGAKVREFEAAWAKKFGYKYAVTTNSWTTGLVTAVGAIGISPGDEVITTPYTMSATATAILFWGGVPVFADIEENTFNLDPASIEANITERTKAIMVVHIFGCPANMSAILDIAKRHKLKVIEDAAQSPSATIDGKPVGAIGDIGGFSLNYHKHIHTGEGGVLVTNNEDLAKRSQLLRNHGENVVEAWEVEDLTNMVGNNYRLTELQSAIGIEQLKRLDGIVSLRQEMADFLNMRLGKLDCIKISDVPKNMTHAYYVYALRYDEKTHGVSRETFVEAVNAELPAIITSDDIPLTNGYIEPLYMSPLYQKKIAFGANHYPFSLDDCKQDYKKGLCPTVERMQEKELMLSTIVRDPLNLDDMEHFASAIEKTVRNISQLKK